MSLKITHLRHIALKTPNPAGLADFYQNKWGLKITDEQDGTFFLRGLKLERFILQIVPGDRRGIDHLAFGLNTRLEVEAAYEYLSGQGIPLYSAPAELTTPGGGYGFRLLDPDGRRLELSAGVAEADANESWEARLQPNKISHTVLNTPRFEQITEFYVNLLGFRISDWSEQQMVFLRCNNDHHSVAFNRAAHASLNHVAYELQDIDSVMRGIGNLKRLSVNPVWGPGRHGPGNNVFCYFQDAAGYVCEYTAEVQKIDEATHTAQIWERSIPEKMDRWGISGPPSPEARLAMAGEPDSGYLQRQEELSQ